MTFFDGTLGVSHRIVSSRNSLFFSRRPKVAPGNVPLVFIVFPNLVFDISSIQVALSFLSLSLSISHRLKSEKRIGADASSSSLWVIFRRF